MTDLATTAPSDAWIAQATQTLNQFGVAVNPLSLKLLALWPAATRTGAASANNFVSTLTARWNEQYNCELRGGTGASNCTAEQHLLTFKSSAAGACDTVFTFDAKNTSGGNLLHPDQLKNKLMFVGGSSNPYLAFSSTGTTVSIDPTYGLDEDPNTSTGSCSVACTKMSATSQLGKCCSCNGKTSTYAKSTVNAMTYLCQ